MGTLAALITSDVADVFLNTDEFAVTITITALDATTYTPKAVVTDEEIDRETDQEQGQKVRYTCEALIPDDLGTKFDEGTSEILTMTVTHNSLVYQVENYTRPMGAICLELYRVGTRERSRRKYRTQNYGSMRSR